MNAFDQHMTIITDFRDVPKPFFTFSTADKNATNGGFPWRSFDDSSQR